MVRKRQLSEKQLAVIDDLFGNELEEGVILQRHGVTRNVYNKWQSDEVFREEFSRRIESAHRQSCVLLAKYAPVAAAKLIQLIESPAKETARKACLDIISLPVKKVKEQVRKIQEQEPAAVGAVELAEETASKLLEVLANEKGKTTNKGGLLKRVSGGDSSA